ncbi:hypothetical protein AVEN_249089-1 [Araneus ventricosus]|uniref:Uncharacterized protein n=1 Tax=Araneus ventricosus TaxID=182803 RepID=A0A4Y2PAV6_ARAVE|nr:hypothetical protein AVEN_249089-1 [Araneus ventricosus]
MRNTNSQQITDNDSNSTFNSAQITSFRARTASDTPKSFLEGVRTPFIHPHSTGCYVTWKYLAHLETLYKTVTERVLAHGAVAWCLEPTVRIARKLSTIQRPFLLAISGAYRTTSTAALQVILGIPPLHLQLQREARGAALFRLRLPLSTNISDIDPSEIEEKATGWSTHPSEHLSPTQISLDDGGNINTGLRIYTDGSKTERSVVQPSVF